MLKFFVFEKKKQQQNKSNAIFALRYQRVSIGQKINRQPSNEQANISRQMSQISLLKN